MPWFRETAAWMINYIPLFCVHVIIKLRYKANANVCL